MGENYAKAFKEAVSGIEACYAWIVERNPRYDVFVERAEILKEYFYLEHKEEIEGFASQFSGGTPDRIDGKLSLNEIYTFNTHKRGPRGECSTIAVYGSRTETGNTISGRLMDYEDYYTITIFTVKNGSRSVLCTSFLNS